MVIYVEMCVYICICKLNKQGVCICTLCFPQIKGLQQNKEMTLASNRLLAEQNLKLQPRLDHQKNELTIRYRSLQELFEAYQLRKSTLGKILGITCNISLPFCVAYVSYNYKLVLYIVVNDLYGLGTISTVKTI